MARSASDMLASFDEFLNNAEASGKIASKVEHRPERKAQYDAINSAVRLGGHKDRAPIKIGSKRHRNQGDIKATSLSGARISIKNDGSAKLIVGNTEIKIKNKASEIRRATRRKTSRQITK